MKQLFPFFVAAALLLTGCGAPLVSPKATLTHTSTATPTLTPTATRTFTPAPSKTGTSTRIPLQGNIYNWSTLVPNQSTQTPYPPPEEFKGFPAVSLASIVAKHKTNISSEQFTIFSDWESASATVEYSGMLRPLDGSRVIVLWQIGTALGYPDYANLFEHELLVREGEVEYWMPIQESLIPFLEEELIEGQLMTIFVRLPALVHTDEGTECVFFINDFHR